MSDVQFADPVGFTGAGNVKTAIHGGDAQLYVEFYKNPTDGLDHIKMRIPGDKLTVPDFIADERYQRRFPRQWEAYKTNKDQFEGEVRLEDLAWIDQANRLHYNSFGVFTLEGLSKVSDGNLSNLGPEARKLRERAQAEVDERRKAASYEQSEAEKAAMRTEMDGMQETLAEMADLKAQLAELQKPKRPRRTKEEMIKAREEADAA